eukprot:TRINITY_DN73797_c0_g1_i1.p1 TRINITY_DN73797_c0_g1~~TRINITY_DN73797_c0_g1_i1.p1  ORF type:complete len:240 (+),score=65.72 TRINITY_DN73797_c0_g1_i1:35-754(+)
MAARRSSPTAAVAGDGGVEPQPLGHATAAASSSTSRAPSPQVDEKPCGDDDRPPASAAAASLPGDARKQRESTEDWALRCCHVFTLAIVAASCVAAATCAAAILAADKLQCWAAVGTFAVAAWLAALVAAAELEVRLARPSLVLPFLDYWVGRGLALCTVGVLMRGSCTHACINVAAVEVLVESVPYALIAAGAFRALGGLLCLGPFLRWRQRKADRRLGALRELEAMEQRRKELESMI